MKLAKLIELLISACIIVVIVCLIVFMLKSYFTGAIDLYQQDALEIFLKRMLSFAVGIEFVKMLVQHSPESVIEVLIFATSRQLIVEHTEGLETIVRIVGIGILFAIKKFLLPSKEKKAPPALNK